MSLDLIAERYSASGSMVARTLTRAVRNTDLDVWSNLLRETLQNSVDARVSQRNPIDFSLTLDKATAQQRNVLRQDVFGITLSTQLQGLSTALRDPGLSLLVIADWGTRGLGGPTRADTVTSDRTDFRDFFLNVGREEAKSYQGGTFGLGRGVLFDISDVSTIVVFTRTSAAGRQAVRLMAMSLTDTFDKGGHRYTGRHWWGHHTDGSQPAPVTGRDAERIAERLGLAVIPPESTGTAIMVIAPRIPYNEDESARLVDPIDEMIRAATKFGWPLMIGGQNGKPVVRFSFGNNDESWTPSPPDAVDSPVRHFVDAYRIAVGSDRPEEPTSWRVQDIHFRAGGKSEPRTLGKLVFRHLPPPPAGLPPADDGYKIPHASIALMRDPRMVVRYLDVPKHPAGSSTVGVFVADTAFDKQFAESEPVSHDDWHPAKITSAKFQFNPVKQALEKVRKAVKDTLIVSKQQSLGAGRDGLAPVIGDLLGGLVADTQGFGGTPRSIPASPSKSSRSRSTRAVVLAPSLRPTAEGLVALFPVQIHRVVPGATVRLSAKAMVVLDRGVEKEDQRPADAPSPAIAGWENTSGELIDDRGKLTVDGSVTEVVVKVAQPPDTVVTVEVDATEFGE